MAQTQTLEIVRTCGDYEVVIHKRESHYIDLLVYSVLGRTSEGRAMYNREGYTSSPDPVESREAAQVFIEGSLKWDGCLDLNFEDQPIHFCGEDDADEFAKLLPFIYELGKELIEAWEG